MSEKIQKVIARSGAGSRRKIETWISVGRVKVNGKLATTGQRVTAADKITLDDRPLKIIADSVNATKVLIYNKPLGEICTRSDPEGRPTVFQNLPQLDEGRWISVGRLDINSEGLLLFTNNGELANRLMHPSKQLEREYLARVFGVIDAKVIKDLQAGVQLDDGKANFTSIRPIKQDGVNRWFSVVITEGRNRLVRRLWQTKKIQVSRLIRIRFCAIMLPRSLNSGRFRELATKDVKLLLKTIGLSE